MGDLVTIFGGSGFIGTQTVRRLTQRGWRVRVVVRHPHKAIALNPLGNVGQIHIVRGDIGDPRSVSAALRGATAAVNLVGLLYETAGRRFQQVHVEGVRTIVEACRDHQVARFVQVSAIGADAKARSSYARTKGEAEAVARRTLPQTTVLRPSIVFGPGDGFFNRFAQMATQLPALPLIGGGATRFQPVYVGDVADAIARAVEPGVEGRAFELGGPEIYSFADLLKMVLRETHRNRALIPLPFTLASAIGVGGDLMAFFTGLEPPLTSDQVLLLRRDNIVSAGASGLLDLGVRPTGVEAVLPGYLWRYRPGGQFADAAAGL